MCFIVIIKNYSAEYYFLFIVLAFSPYYFTFLYLHKRVVWKLLMNP